MVSYTMDRTKMQFAICSNVVSNDSSSIDLRPNSPFCCICFHKLSTKHICSLTSAVFQFANEKQLHSPAILLATSLKRSSTARANQPLVAATQCVQARGRGEADVKFKVSLKMEKERRLK